ncbi:MAG: type IV toxin-antitoxin system AbiEi family antitoxin [Bacteroidota bacterium]
MVTRENDILNQAIDAFQKETNLHIELGPQQHVRGDKEIDAILRIDLHGKTTEYWAEIKTTVTNITVGQIAHQFEDNREKCLLITRYVQPQLAKALRDLHIQFIDTVGNAYINYPPTFIFIHGNKPEPQADILPEEGILGRAGTQVIFALLCKRELCNAPYRDIAEQAQVALGAVAKVMKDLAAQGFLVELNDKQRRLVRRKELLDKWLNAYAEKLRPKKFIDRYKATKPDFWQQAEIERFDAQWGGEVAAYRLTRYLKPEIVTIYTRKPIHNLILNLKLRQDKNGDIELRERFWKCENPELDKTMVPPLLVYADLMATGETRNIETAKQLYNDYLQRYIDQD